MSVVILLLPLDQSLLKVPGHVTLPHEHRACVPVAVQVRVSPVRKRDPCELRMTCLRVVERKWLTLRKPSPLT